MDLSLHQSIIIAPNVICRELAGELVILNLQSGIYFGLDPVAARIWALIQEHGALEKVFDTIRDEYEVEPDTLKRDLLDLVGELCAKGLCTASPPTAR
jgi:coenzyme PQQ synthesis protein D (PqqD)